MNFKRQMVRYSAVLALVCTVQAVGTELTEVEKMAAVCFSCHGDKGNSSDPNIPSLAGQQPVYTVNQLKAFKAGSRVNATMQTQATQLSEEEITNFGAYFAVQKAHKFTASPTLIQQGKAKSIVCLGCHGAAGEGNGQFPRLAGQQPDYLVQQLKLYQSGGRKNGAMQAIASNLSEEEIKALAAFLGSL